MSASAATPSGARARKHPRARPDSDSDPNSPGTTTTTALGSAAETLSSAKESVQSAAETAADALAKHILYADLPPWRRDNAYILSGYRPTSNSFSLSLRSLLYLHNETVNIWSHLLGALASCLAGAAAYNLIHPRYVTASPADVLVFSCFFLGAVACLGMSATYHAVCNHSHEVARWGNKLDYTGIVFLIVGSYVPALWYGFYCHPGLMTAYLTAVSCLLLLISPTLPPLKDKRDRKK